MDGLLERERFAASFGQLFRRYGSRGERIPSARRDGGAVSSVQKMMQDRYGEQLTLEDLVEIVSAAAIEGFEPPIVVSALTATRSISTHTRGPGATARRPTGAVRKTKA